MGEREDTMRVLGCALLLICLSSPLSLASTEPTYAEILTDSTFQAKIAENVWMVDFFAPWCGHCKKLAPEMDKLVGMVDGIARVGTVDATANRASADAYDVHGYPSLKLFTDKGQKVTTFKGPRDAEHIAAFVNKMLSAPVELLHNQEEITKFKAAYPTSFLLLSTASEKVRKTFESLANERQADVYFARTEIDFESDETNEKSSVVALNDGKLRASFDAEDPTGLFEFIDDYFMPMCPELSRATFWDFANSPKNVVLALLDHTDRKSAEIQRWLCEQGKTSIKYRYAWMDSVKHEQLLGSMSVTKDDTPVVLVLDTPNKIHFVHRNSSWTVDEFITQVEAGNVPKEGDGASWWAWAKGNMLGFCVVCFVAVIGFFIWLGDPSQVPDASKKFD